MDQDRIERRAKMLDKVRKLLAMARDGRGNANEEETAMRQANKLMAEFGIAEAECDMSAMDAGELSYGEAQAGMDGRAPEPGKVYKSYSTWVGQIAIGVGVFTDSIVGRKTTAAGHVLTFRGEQQDVLLARWLLGVLVAGVQTEQRTSGWHGKADANLFRQSASTTLATRLKTMAKERRDMYEQAKRESNSRALVVVDRKAMEIARLFGKQKYDRGRSSSSGDRGASIAGREAGQRINIPAGRPIGNQSRTMLN